MLAINLTNAMMVVVLGMAVGVSSCAQESKPVTKAEVEQLVKEYILKNPEVIIDSVRQYQERAQAAEKKRTLEAVSTRQEELLRDPASPASKPFEKTGGQVTIVEFFDYRCGYCKKVRPTVAKLLADNANVRMVFKEFPILGPESTVAAKAALAAEKQGKYVPFHQAMMAATDVSENGVEKVAKEVGLDVAKMKADMQSPAIAAALEKNMQLAQAMGVTATPTFVVGSEVVAGAIDAKSFQNLIAKAQPKQSEPAKP